MKSYIVVVLVILSLPAIVAGFLIFSKIGKKKPASKSKQVSDVVNASKEDRRYRRDHWH